MNLNNADFDKEVAYARLASRRLKAAARRRPMGKRAAQIAARLDSLRSCKWMPGWPRTDTTQTNGQIYHANELRRFRIDWREAIDSECRYSARTPWDKRLSEGHKAFNRDFPEAGDPEPDWHPVSMGKV